VFLTYSVKLYKSNGAIHRLPVKHYAEYFMQFQQCTGLF